MNPIEIRQLKALIVATSMYYGQEFQDQVVNLFVEDLVDLPFERVANAIKEARLDPKTTRFPLPAVIRAKIITVGPSDEDQAIEAANRIVAAVSKHGWCNHEAARASIGELGWRVVSMEGGWRSVCEMLSADNLTSLKAQWRGLAKSTLTRYRAGVVDIAPKLENKPKSGELTSLGDLLAKIEGPK